jgi:predicted Zn-dependent protease
MTDSSQLFNQALTAIERGRRDLAIDRLQRLINQDPTDAEAIRLLVQVHREADEHRQAERLLTAVTELVPEDLELWLELADVRLHLGEPKAAAQAVKKVLVQRPEHWEAHYLLGNAFSDVKAYAEAAKVYRLSLSSNPFEAETWHNLAVALEKLGDAAGAREATAEFERLSTAQIEKAADTVDSLL